MRFINEMQTPKTRRKKYRMMLKAGFSSATARRARDWTTNHVKTTIELNGVKNGKEKKQEPGEA